VKWRAAYSVTGMRYCRWAAVAFALLSLLFPACASSHKSAQNQTKTARLFAVTVDSAAFFRYGPQAGRDPDLKLPKDTIVKLIRPSFGYSKIQLITSGVRGYVASEEIGPASPTLLAAANTPPTSRRISEQFHLDSNDPRLTPPPEELPDPDLPAPAPEPSQ
jgi:hypothetical protein